MAQDHVRHILIIQNFEIVANTLPGSYLLIKLSEMEKHMPIMPMLFMLDVKQHGMGDMLDFGDFSCPISLARHDLQDL